MKKKCISLLLTVAMLFGICAIPAFAADSQPYVKSDTTVDFTVAQTQVYQFRFEIVGPRGLQPNITTGNGKVLQTEAVNKKVENGHDVYYFQVRAIGQVGEGAGVYTTLPGQNPVRHCVIKVGAPYIKSDTTVDFTVEQGKTYAFRFEVMGPRGLAPNIVAGNGKVLQTESVRKVVERGNDVYYFQVRAIGQPGEASAIYTTLPGQQPVKHCTITITGSKPSPTPGQIPKPNSSRFYGIDVSHHQGVIDWDAVKAAGVDFVMLRAGYGQNNIDAQFTRNISECNRLGIPVGVYWFSYALTPEDAAEEAKYCMNAVAPYKLQMPISCDVEYDTVRYAATKGVTIDKNLATEMADAFCSTVEANGYYAMNYMNQDYSRNMFDMQKLAGYDVWYAMPSTDESRAYPGAKLWQNSTFGTVSGINGQVDMDTALVNYPAIIRNAGLNHLNGGAPTFKVDYQPVVAQQPKTATLAANSRMRVSVLSENQGGTTGGAEPDYVSREDQAASASSSKPAA
jgi:GH25 family lysozyme M1 (1,4-beta-N-acetylmuramidase)